MVQVSMHTFGAPLGKHDWCQKWCCDVHNHLAQRSLDWKTPMEVSTGSTPDISVFCFHFWEPIWYYEPIKQPKDNLQKGRWLGFAHSCGDAMTYYICTEKSPDKGRNVVLVCSVIKT